MQDMKPLRKLLLLLAVILVYACIGVFLAYPMLKSPDNEISTAGEILAWAYGVLGIWIIVTVLSVWHDDSV